MAGEHTANIFQQGFRRIGPVRHARLCLGRSGGPVVRNPRCRNSCKNQPRPTPTIMSTASTVRSHPHVIDSSIRLVPVPGTVALRRSGRTGTNRCHQATLAQHQPQGGKRGVDHPSFNRAPEEIAAKGMVLAMNTTRRSPAGSVGQPRSPDTRSRRRWPRQPIRKVTCTAATSSGAQAKRCDLRPQSAACRRVRIDAAGDFKADATRHCHDRARIASMHCGSMKPCHEN